MILQRMDADALQKAKVSLAGTYRQYLTEDDPAWMEQAWGPNTFVPFREVADFHLAPVAEYAHTDKGQLDLNNCIAVYEGLRRCITPAEASYEVLWAGITNCNCYSYMRERWQYNQGPERFRGKEPAQMAGAIEARFFFSRNGNGLFRNTIAKCWWVAHLLYDSGQVRDPYWRLRTLGALSFSTKVTDLFVNYAFARSQHVLDGVLQGIEVCRERGVPIDHRASEILRPSLKHLNAVGGAVILDALPPEQIAEILSGEAQKIWQQAQSSGD